MGGRQDSGEQQRGSREHFWDASERELVGVMFPRRVAVTVEWHAPAPDRPLLIMHYTDLLVCGTRCMLIISCKCRRLSAGLR